MICERYTFNNCSQKVAEKFDDYVVRLRKLASTCEFGTLADDLIRDRIVCGVNNDSIRKRMLQESKLTLAKCINMCQAYEATTSQMKAMSQPDVEANYVNKGKHRFKGYKKNTSSRKSYSASGTNTITDCKFCGKEHELSKNKCPAQGKTCAICKGIDHFAVKCPRSHKQRPKQRPYHGKRNAKAHVVEDKAGDCYYTDDTGSSYDYDEDDLCSNTVELVPEKPANETQINTVQSDDTGTQSTNKHTTSRPSRKNYAKKICVSMEIEGRNYPVLMQIDSGATCNVIPENYLPPNSMLTRSNHSLSMYNKETVPVLGSTKLHVRNTKTRKRYTLCHLL